MAVRVAISMGKTEIGEVMIIGDIVTVIVAIIHRYDDVEEKWVVAPEGMSFSKEEIMKQVSFQEQYFDSEVRM